MLLRSCRLLILQECSSTSVVIAENSKSLAHSGETLGQLSLCHLEVGVLLSTDLVHFCLLLGKVAKIRLQLDNLLLEGCRACCSPVDFVCQLLDGRFEVGLLCLGLCHLLVAVGLFRGLSF